MVSRMLLLLSRFKGDFEYLHIFNLLFRCVLYTVMAEVSMGLHHPEVEIKQLMEHFNCLELELLDMSGKPRVRFVRGTSSAGKRCTACKGLFTMQSYNLKRKGLRETQSYCKQCSYIRIIASKRGVASKLREEAGYVAEEIKNQLTTQMIGEDKRVTRKTWPIDKEKRLISAAKIMRQALIDWEGQEAAIAAALRLPMSEVMAVIEASEALTALYEEMQNYAIAKVERRIYNLALESNSPTAGMFYLKTERPEKYGDKSQIEVRNVGFAPPPADAERPTSILELIKKKAVNDEQV